MTAIRSRTTRVVRMATRGASQGFWFWTGTEGNVPGAAGGGGRGATGGTGAGWVWNEDGRIITRVNSPGPAGWAGGGG